MIEYIVWRIKEGKMNYEKVIEKYPEMKKDIDILLGK